MTANSVSRYHANLKTAFDCAVTEGWMPANPARAVKAPKKVAYEADFYYMDEIVELWRAVKGSIIEPAVFLTSLYGFRRGEILGLKKDALDFKTA